VTVSKTFSDRRWSGNVSVIGSLTVICYSWSYWSAAGTNVSADTEL